ncbi:MAG: hypothetical protein COV09_00210 [Candidatus Vogelbacteria bacterium CG10_big_fil_rev_8_21_14_0_10_50_13]|uniref:Glycosyltransferase RgtA/B/C/D-like domain-containing protein n=1 Tax=Candidatus Vogelbacteria bacterium CG10_big_fil_rev_8_21_14_0_10_50_13 TaxID=1975044 RepID=A0A2H0RGH7_9BACT|nr:MAG: hypothetical protein COV09_00210 [Candidatus Vogelbacteria bacterium CG10_big_fil_rev_8_21_14_0_10_50_13]
MLTRIYTIINHHRFWWLIVAGAAVLRLAGLFYGLPLLLVADEPSAIFGALKMLELKTVIPALHSAEFASVLYYPPYLSYLFLLPFAAVGGLGFLLSGQSLEVFTNLLIVDSSVFFILARLLSVAASIISLILIYQVARRLFATAPAWVATLSVFFLAVSPTYLALGSVARHWVFISLLVAVILRLLVSDLKRKYFWSLLAAGLAMGISTIASVGVVLIGGWLLVGPKVTPLGSDSKVAPWGIFKVRPLRPLELIAGLATFAFLAWLPNLLYPQSLGFVNDVSLLSGKSLPAALGSAPQFLLTAGRVEILLIALATVGILFLVHDRKFFGWLALIFTLFYSLLFYLLFHFETRFLMPLLPLFALAAAYGSWRLVTVKVTPWNLSPKVSPSGILFKVAPGFEVGPWGILKVRPLRPLMQSLVVLVILMMLITGLRFAYLTYQDDTRVLAYDWARENIPSESRVIVAGELLRLPTTAQMSAEVESLGSQFTRRADQAEASLAKAGIDYGPAFKALNLYTFNPDTDREAVMELIKATPIDYVIIDDDSPWQLILDDYLANGRVVKQFTGSGDRFLYTAGHFWGFPWELWQFNRFGPEIKIYGF